MNSRKRMQSSFLRKKTDRIPTMPQISHDLAIRVYAQEDGIHWIEAMKSILENPKLSNEYTIRLAKDVGCDGLRIFTPNNPVKTIIKDEELFVIDPETEERIGKVDLYGGGKIVMDKIMAPIETQKEAQLFLNTMVSDLSEEKLSLLKEARDSVPDLFVSYPPGAITLNTYNVLRGREQALVDLIERPNFVRDILDRQVEMVIKRAEKALAIIGMDAFYIGDPSASCSLISPSHFEEICLPAYKKFCDHFKNTDVLIYMHICGNSNPILEMMAESGVHCVEPLDPLGGVSVLDAKKRIGNKVALMGGVNTVTLASESSDAVKAEAIQVCREGGPEGYILASGDMVPPDTPKENLQALVDVARYNLWRKK